jgi:large subunit ribosomal protein L28
MVNLNRVTLRSETLNKNFKFRVAASTLRTIDKHGGLDGFLSKMSTRKLTDKASKIKKLIEKNVTSTSN